jgi:hypothetical protein
MPDNNNQPTKAMSAREGIQKIVATLQERGIALGREDVAPAFDSAKTKDDALKWAREYVDNTILLTRDELDL